MKAGRHQRAGDPHARGYQILKLEAIDADEDAAVRARRASRSASASSPTSARTNSRSTSQKLRAQAIIEWKNEDVKKAYEEGLKQQATAATASPLDGRDAAPQWFAIWTRSRHEQVVREQLERKRIDAFLPTITRWSRWKDRKKKIDWPLFPGYCFARFDLDDALPILKCTGVVNIVSFDGKPAPIPEYELDSIRLLVGSELQYDPCPLIHEG